MGGQRLGQLCDGTTTTRTQGKVSIADATELLRLKDHPQALKEVTARLAEDDYDSDVGWTVHHALRELERQQRRTAVVEELSAKGVAVIDHDGYGPPPGLALLGRYGGIELDAQAHAGESCTSLVVTSNGDQHPACNDAKRHAKKGAKFGGLDPVVGSEGGGRDLSSSILQTVAMALLVDDEHE